MDIIILVDQDEKTSSFFFFKPFSHISTLKVMVHIIWTKSNALVTQNINI